MRPTFFRVMTGVFVFSVFFVSTVFAQGSLEEQVAQILEAQKRIEGKLNTIEARQRGILNSLNKMQPVGPQAAARAQQPPPPAIDPGKPVDIDIGKTPIRGNKDAKATIYEFTEIQCPYSKRAQPTIIEVLKAYPKDVRLVYKHFPLSFHPLAKPGAKAMYAAGEQGKYFEMMDALFELTNDEISSVVKGPQEGFEQRAEELFKSVAKKVGLNVKKFLKDYKEKDAEWEKLIAEDIKVATSVGVRGTPTLFLNGRRMRARDFNTFKTEIDKILNKDKE